ncbi:MAG: hypothetical protein ABIT01_16310 [Thermoanaerobaculia bacterium]
MAAVPETRRDWKAEADELRTVVFHLRRKLLALAMVLPIESLPLLEADPETIESAVDLGDLHLLDFDDGLRMVESDVATELRLLWARLAVRGGA